MKMSEIRNNGTRGARLFDVLFSEYVDKMREIYYSLGLALENNEPVLRNYFEELELKKVLDILDLTDLSIYEC